MIKNKHIYVFVSVICLILSLSACVVTPYTGDSKNKETVEINEPTESSLNEYRKASSFDVDSTVSTETQSETLGTSSKINAETSENITASSDSVNQNIDGEISFIANSNSMKFHKSTCQYAKKIKDINKVVSNNRDELISQGFVPCKKCCP